MTRDVLKQSVYVEIMPHPIFLKQTVRHSSHYKQQCDIAPGRYLHIQPSTYMECNYPVIAIENGSIKKSIMPN